jgi:hypothetical protein
MRAAILCLFLVACSSSGKSIGPDDCTHTQQPTTACCLVDTQCMSAICAPPGTPQICGSCDSSPSTCTTDAQCKTQISTSICEPRACACTDERDCVAGCTSDAGCDDGETCNLTSNRCEVTTCATAATCPQDFDCLANRCIRKGCISNADCDAFCVDGLCYQEAGECRLPAA